MDLDRLAKQIDKVGYLLRMVLEEIDEIATELKNAPEHQSSEPPPEVGIEPWRPQAKEEERSKSRTYTHIPTTLSDLLRAGYLLPGDLIETVRYGRTERATITESGNIRWKNIEHPSPSNTAGHAHESMGGPFAQNGWRVWILVRTGQQLAQIRKSYMDRLAKNNN